MYVPRGTFSKFVHGDFLHRTCPGSSQIFSNRHLLFPMVGSSCDVKPSSIVQQTCALYYALEQDPNDVDLLCDMQTVREQVFFEMYARQTHEMNARQKEKGIIRRKKPNNSANHANARRQSISSAIAGSISRITHIFAFCGKRLSSVLEWNVVMSWRSTSFVHPIIRHVRTGRLTSWSFMMVCISTRISSSN